MPELMIDSGAFSIMTRGAKLDVESYGRFLVDYGYWAQYKINFDVIPPVGEVTPEQCIECAEAGWKNYLYLKGLGVQGLMPVYHLGEPLYFFDRMLDTVEGVIAVSASSSWVSSMQQRWYEEIFTHIARRGGPLPKLHLLGELNAAINRLPWYSVDAASPFLQAAYGGVALFVYEEGEGKGLRQIALLHFNKRGQARSRGGGGKPAASYTSMEEYPPLVQETFNRAYEKAEPLFRKLYPRKEPTMDVGRFKWLISLISLVETQKRMKIKLFVGLGSINPERAAIAAGTELQHSLVTFATWSDTEGTQRGWRQLRRWVES